MTAHLSGTDLMFGREAELERLRQMLAATLQGNGGTVLIGGEAGIGKTTLVDELARSARELGADVVTGGSYDFSITPPYGPWKDAAERTGWPELAALLYADERDGHPQGQDELFPSVIRLVTERTAASPLLIVLEDLHWSDAASLDLLRYVARHTHRHHVLLALTYRDDEISRRHPLSQIIPILVHETRAERIDLRPLGDRDVQALVAGRYLLAPADRDRLVSYLQDHAEGNPFFLGEVLRTLEVESLLTRAGASWKVGSLDRAPVPPLVLQIIEGRLSRLDATTRSLLEAAAVIGQVVPFEIWRQNADVEANELLMAIDQASAAHVLTWQPGDERLHFDHALTREALYAGIPPPRRQALHQRIAEALLGLKEPDPDAVSYHFQQSGDPRAVGWLVLAGLRARRSNAWITAADRFQMAATLLDAHDEHTSVRGWLLLYTGYLLRFSDDPRTLEHLYEAERVALVNSDSLLAAFVLYHRGASRCMRGNVRTGLEELRRGVAMLDSIAREQIVLETETKMQSAIQALIPGDMSSSPPTPGSPILDADQQPAITQQRGVLVNWLGQSGHYREALATGEAFANAVESATREDLLASPQVASAMLGLGHTYAALGRPDDARTRFESAKRIFSSVFDYAMAEYAINCDVLLVAIPYQADDPAERPRLREEAAGAWARSNGLSIVARGDLAPSELSLCYLEGRWETAYQLALERRFAGTISVFQEAHVTLARLDHEMGNTHLAWERVHCLLPAGPATEPGDSFFVHAIAAVAVAVELALDSGDLDQARAWLETHGRWLVWSGASRWQTDDRLLWARWNQLQSDLERARRCALEALELAARPRQPLRLLSALRFLGELATTEGRYADADQRLTTALALAQDCQAPYEEGLTRIAIAELRAAASDVSAAGVQLDIAREICATIGARTALTRVERLDIDLSNPPPSPPANPHGLTRREVEVLRLIATGRSNRQIAIELYLSPRTVERHIANIYLKIDVHNKVEATAFALRNNLA